MATMIYLPQLKKEVLEYIKNALHRIRMQRTIDNVFPHLKLYLLELRKEVELMNVDSPRRLSGFRELVKQSAALNTSLKEKVEILKAAYNLSTGKSAKALFPYRYHRGSVEYYAQCVMVMKKLPEFLAWLDVHLQRGWSMKDFEREVEDFKTLMTERKGDAHLQREKKSLLAYRAMLQALQKSFECVLEKEDV